jgi:Ca2+-transporting ATPase
MKNGLSGFSGLTESQVIESRHKFGSNSFEKEKGKDFFVVLKEVVTEPMFMLLIAACLVYFFVKQYSEGMIMLVAMLFVASISFFQERRSRKALDVVRKMSQPNSKVIRDNNLQEISSEEIVVGDIVLIEEGDQTPADGKIVQSHDFSVDESILTGESFAIDKDVSSENNKVYLGSTVRSGSAIVEVLQVGVSTMLGRLGKSIEEIKPSQSRFQKEIRSFIRVMAIAGVVAFVLVFGINFYKSSSVLTSLLFALALAMSILPEEIPVAFSTFMALGSWRLLKQDVLVKDPQVIETLGSATVICIDKTGTITENKMALAKIYSYKSGRVVSLDEAKKEEMEVLSYAMWASEPSPFDPMEVAIHQAYEKIDNDERDNYEMIHEYPLSGKPPVMTHIYSNGEGHRIIACKGGAESVVVYSNISSENSKRILSIVSDLAREGYRVLGVAKSSFEGNQFPDEQNKFQWEFLGLVALYDPPKKNSAEVLQKFYTAGIKVKILSGDYPETTCAIANEIGFVGVDCFTTGNEVLTLDDQQLQKLVQEKNIFARMFPEAKLRVVNALKRNGEVVAMTGDGVNDGPALKAADIGVSMGSKGTEIAKRAASVVLLGNDLRKMFYAIVSGRKIYSNLKKAIQYILSIHISIISAVTVPLLLNWEVVNIFSPIHIIFFELIMGPTCSIIYENEPAEKNIEQRSPRTATAVFLKLSELSISIVQGLIIAVGVLIVYYLSIQEGLNESTIRTLVFSTIVLSNIFLTLENRSFEQSLLSTLRYKNSLIYFIIALTGLLLGLILTVPFMRNLFLLQPITIRQLLLCLFVSMISVFWLEGYKLIKRRFFKRMI